MKIVKIIITLIFFFSCQYVYTNNNKIYQIDVNSGIGPATSAYIKRGLDHAKENDANALLITLNTPGGLLSSTRDIVGKILESETPVIVYVSPGGARAGSAGVFIALSGNIAAMAPGTNIGAAHPVGPGGESDSSVMTDKVTNDAAAFVRTIATKRGKNPDWAELTVRHSISSTETEALDSNAIDYICKNIPALLDSVHGRQVETARGYVIMQTRGAVIEKLEMSWREELLSIISDPNIAYILLMIGIYGLMFELFSPGTIFPGVIGAMCLILGAYSMQMLPVNYAGLALIILAVVLFLIEIKVVSYGLLTVGGIISLFLGSIMLIDKAPGGFVGISLGVIIAVIIISVIFFGFVIALGVKAQFRKKIGGKDDMIGMTGLVKLEIAPGKNGSVKVRGELWKAESKSVLEPGSDIVVVGIEGFVLQVEAKK